MTGAGRVRRFLEASVHAHAASDADALAILSAGRTACTYGQFAAQLDRLGTAFADLLPGQNHVIAVAASGGPDQLTAIVAAMSYAICAPFDPARPPADVDAFLADVGPSLVLADEAAIARHGEAFDRYGTGVVRMSAASTAPAGVFDVVVAAPYRRREPLPEYEPDVAVIVRTSGTTARSKIVPHTLPRLLHVGTSVAGAMSLSAADRCLNAIPLHHVYAITSVINPSLLAGSSIVCSPDAGAAALVENLRVYRPTWYTAAPAMHRDVLAYLRREAKPLDGSLRFARTMGAPLDRQLQIDFEAVLGAPILIGYGTTEAPSAAFNVLPSNRHGSVGLPVGCEIAILDGEVAIRGANVAPAYAGGERRPIADPATGWYRTGDAGHFDADGYLYITGRLNELINVGGVKVAPELVEEALTAHPAVADAVVFPLPHPTLGQHVAAAVVRRPGASVTERELMDHVVLLVASQAVPNVVHFVPEIERDAAGKVRRRDLTARFARKEPVEPLDPKQAEDDPVLRALVRIWEDVLEYAPVAVDENFFAAGGDSLRAVRAVMRIEADLGITLPLDVLLFAPTICELASAVRNHANGMHRDRIVALRTGGSRPPLFFYDGDINAGGLYSRFLPHALDAEQPIYVVHPHGALGDAIPESIEAMAVADALMIATAVPSQTYRLAGFCLGGVVAFEVARRLEQAGSTVDVVALVASSTPNASFEALWALTSRTARVLSERGAAFLYKSARSIAIALRSWSSPTKISNAMYLQWHSPTPPTPSDRIYSDRLLRYFPKPTERSIDLIWPDDDMPRILGDPSMGWGHVARVRRHAVGGDHKTVVTDHIGELGAALRRILDAADRGELE